MMHVQTADELDSFYQQPDPWSFHGDPQDERRRHEMLGALPKRTYRRALDIGCGNGFLTLSLPGDELVGVDLSEKAIEWARKAAEDASQGARSRFEALSLFDPALESLGRFDLVVITGVLYPQYLGKSLSVARLQLDKVLEPGGILASCHIRGWGQVELPYSRLDVTLYPYRQYIHQLEIYVK